MRGSHLNSRTEKYLDDISPPQPHFSTTGVLVQMQAGGCGSREYLFGRQHVTSIAHNPLQTSRSVSSLSFESCSSRDEPSSTSNEEKTRIFRGYLAMILSCVYAVFIVTLGLVIYISDVVLVNTSMAEMYGIYLVAFGLAWFIYLYNDIRRYLKNARKDFALQQRRNGVQWSRKSVSVPHYCFNQGRHSGSFYLKIGAAGFCFGHLIHSLLLFGYQVSYLTSSEPHVNKCASIPTLVLDILYPTYSFVQLFFIFKYSNVIINHCTELARFALMHCIASSLCFWVWTILRETVDSLSHLHHNRASAIQNLMPVLHEERSEALHYPITPLPITSKGAQDLVKFLNDTSFLHDHCRGARTLSDNFENFSPYLYPFTIEYSILVVGVLFIMWQNIGRCCGHSMTGRPCWPTCRQLPSGYDADFTSNVVLHADCHSANKGLFAGLIVLVGSAVSIILFFVAMADRAFVATGLFVNAVTELSLLVMMTVAVAVAYRQMTRLDVNKHAVSLLDDLLLFICIPAFFLYAIFSIMPAVHSKSYISIATTVLQVIQVLLQTPFIIDGLRRCSNSRALRYQKPGRELVTFLVVCNVAMWIIETFEIKSQDARDDRFHFYGSVLWTMLSHMTLPLTMFYRFHSSVCLVDIWKSAYEPAEAETQRF
ncbi:proton channel OtopLc-like isoform X2 [Cloeon dipterum]|uniref:proton channel OtopLc-like isoform X2 n=1 Tax=Cloeon dipterum TaxID=197152 RepID=UPI00322043F7